MKGQPTALKALGVALQAIIVVLMIWIVVGSTVFRLRHPWATSTEVFLNMDKALGFKKVSMEEIRK